MAIDRPGPGRPARQWRPLAESTTVGSASTWPSSSTAALSAQLNRFSADLGEERRSRNGGNADQELSAHSVGGPKPDPFEVSTQIEPPLIATTSAFPSPLTSAESVSTSP